MPGGNRPERNTPAPAGPSNAQIQAGIIDVPKPPAILAEEQRLGGKQLEPIYAEETIGRGNRKVSYGPPIGYRYDNGKSEYVNFSPSGEYEGTVKRQSGIDPALLAVLAMPFIGPAAFEALGLTGAGAGAGAAGTAAAFTPEMIAAGLTPGSIGAAGAASGALTGANLAAAAGASGLGGAATLGGLTAEQIAASDLAAYEPASLAELLAPASETAALAPSEVLAAQNVAPSVNEMIASGTYTPGSAGALGATTGALTPAELAAASGVVTEGATPALVEMARAGKGLPSPNEMVASGGGPGSAGAAGAAAGQLTPAELAAANGVSTAGSATAGLTSSMLDKLKEVTGLSADQLKALVGGAGGLLAAYEANQPKLPTGYQGGIPSYTAVQGRAAEPVAGSRPGAGHQYFTGVKFAPAAGLPAAQSNIDAQVADLNKLNAANALARNPVNKAEGGIMGLAHGGKPTHPHGTYLRGDTDGMADKIPGTIDGVQPARLAHG